MTASPKTEKATGSARKASSSTQKATGSARKASGSTQKATGSARKASSSTRKATGSARKASSAKQKTAGSAQRASNSSKRGATGSKLKTSGSRRKAGTGSKQRSDSKSERAIYVYGILPADIELTSEMSGVGDPPGQVRIVRSDGLAALVSDIDTARPLGSPQDLTAHEQIVDATAAAVPVLPARFGAVLASEEEVAEELLGANHDEFGDALTELEGRAQYVVKGRYVENAILQEILSENRQVARLADKVRDANPDATREARIKIGEIINDAVAAKRHKDTRALGNAMEGHCIASIVREPTHELDAVHVAFLVETDEESEMEQAIEDLARDWDGRVELRLLGPMAAYDFVGSVLPEG